MTWTKKNQQFALSCGLRPSSKELAQWILISPRGDEVTQKLIDLKEFNKYIGKNRATPYDPKTIKEAIAQLDELTYGWFKIVKSHNWHLHTILIRPVETAIKEKSRPLESVPRLKQGNPMFSDAHKERLDKLLQHNISKLDSLLSKIGLIYNHCSLKRIWAIAGQKFDEIERGIELMLYQNSIKPGSIVNPQAWLISCLKNRWFESFDLNYSPDLPKFESVREIARFVREVFQGDKLCPE
ncbi:MAG: hypothetical protein RLZZ535_2381 [Cyanobacteriota bacterium]|jgi:hypothetical protein